ncbi:MAG: hypothetical protein A2Z70_02030 [Chloroflexi bacterium RBG_13_48_17]|nr:MAG: hypothetical protein A2Z70_02030 [Chloroflexi bacterium RBG_13_48_17]
MAQTDKKYEIIETRYRGGDKTRTKLDFQGTLKEAKQTSDKKARENIGVRYSVFEKGGFVADFQAYYRTTIKCPKCGEVIPIE